MKMVGRRVQLGLGEVVRHSQRDITVWWVSGESRYALTVSNAEENVQMQIHKSCKHFGEF